MVKFNTYNNITQILSFFEYEFSAENRLLALKVLSLNVCSPG
jgi:hypothetical protein